MRLILADTSAWHRARHASERWSGLLDAGVLATCTPVVLELLYSTRGPADYRALARDLDRLPRLPLSNDVEYLARRVQAGMAAKGHHRAATIVDLFVAATAEVHEALLLHYDRHFDAIGRVTGQPMEWLAPRGSLD